jgi:diguanylate cyclase (GGDEF)-like protein
MIFADRIRQAVAARPVPVSGTEEINLTVSIGLAVYPHDAETGDDLVNLADKALYRAKNEGRNRVRRSRAAGHGEANETGLSESLNRH